MHFLVDYRHCRPIGVRIIAEEIGVRLTYLAGVWTLAISLPATAQDTRDAEFAHADAKLNATYNALLKQLGRGEQAQLRAAQRVWLTFRDLDCRFGWADRRDCLIERTSQREEQLRTSTYWSASGRLIRIPPPK